MAEIQSLAEFSGALGEEAIVVLTQPSWCVPCRRLKPHLESLERGGRNVVVIDLDTVPEAVVEFGVQSVPKVMLYRNGEYVKDLTGRTVMQINREV